MPKPHLEDHAMTIEQTDNEERQCKLAAPVRDSDGRLRFRENLKIVREIYNLGRRMLLVRFDDGATTYLFPNEVLVPVEMPKETPNWAGRYRY
jgi:hypothetical protein